MSGDPHQGPLAYKLAVTDDGLLLVILDGQLTCTACAFTSNTFQVDFSDQPATAPAPAPRPRKPGDPVPHDPGE